jgi:CMP-N,N'-diacetyllegionaminic acid synthase
MILGVIPARGGSKGIQNKNIKELSGKPLINWSIEAAQESKLLDRFIVSTENEIIASIAQKAGAEVLPRPAKFATDNATTVSVLQHVLEEIDANIIVLLQPTSPVRVENIIDKAIKIFQESDCDTLATGYISHHYEWGAFKNLPRQALEGYFHDDGNVYIFKKDILKAGRWIGDNPYRMEISGIYNIEIDNISEFWANEGILINLLNKD